MSILASMFFTLGTLDCVYPRGFLYSVRTLWVYLRQTVRGAAYKAPRSTGVFLASQGAAGLLFVCTSAGSALGLGKGGTRTQRSLDLEFKNDYYLIKFITFFSFFIFLSNPLPFYLKNQ